MVIVVEDDEHIAELVELYLRQDGHDVHRAGDAVAAMELVRARQPSLVVLDIGLPGEIDGLELCRRLRATSRVPIILLTAHDTEIDGSSVSSWAPTTTSPSRSRLASWRRA